MVAEVAPDTEFGSVPTTKDNIKKAIVLGLGLDRNSSHSIPSEG